MLNAGDKKWRIKNIKFFKGECNKCDKYSHRASYYLKTTKTETTIILREIPASTGNAKTVVKEVTGMMIVGQRNEIIKTMAPTTYS